MPLPLHTPRSAADTAERAGIPLRAGRHALVAATADHILTVVSRIRELDLADVPADHSHTAHATDTTHTADAADTTEGR